MLYAFMGLLTFSVVLAAVLQQWRAMGPALALYAVAIALAHWAALGPVVGALKLLAELTAVGILLLGGIAEARAAPAPEAGRGDGQARLYLLSAVTLALAVAYALAVVWPLGGPSVVDFAWYWLVVVGLLVLLSARTYLRVGLGLLLLLGACEVLQTGLTETANLTFLGVGAVAEVLLMLAVVWVAAAGRAREGSADSGAAEVHRG